MKVLFKNKTEVYEITLPASKIHIIEKDNVQIFLDQYDVDLIRMARGIAEIGEDEMRGKHDGN
tara:strand:- start:153 stop:341 length:189 start_codon:yes stop_codon:yes gene_type:complete